MSKLTLPVAMAFATLFAGTALAATVTDTVKSMDATKHTITLNNDQVYQLPATYDLTRVKVGEKVTVTFETRSGTHEATEVMAAK